MSMKSAFYTLRKDYDNKVIKWNKILSKVWKGLK